MRRATQRGFGHAAIRDISIHALHEESDGDSWVDGYYSGAFQSTLSMRRATTRARADPLLTAIFQSTLSMRRATYPVSARCEQVYISIHALHEESDRVCVPLPTFTTFQSTLSMRRATYVAHNGIAYDYISIHALHEESDATAATNSSGTPKFQSTLSMRRATGRRTGRRLVRRYFNPRSP